MTAQPWPWETKPAVEPARQPPVPTSRELAIRCTEAFKVTSADAPPRRLTWLRDRLRFTLTAHLCDGTVHLNDLDTDQAWRLNHELAFLANGTHTWAATDDGLLITYNGRSVLCPWVDPDTVRAAA